MKFLIEPINDTDCRIVGIDCSGPSTSGTKLWPVLRKLKRNSLNNSL